MGLETGSWIDDLVATNPVGGDNLSQADDHLRLLKTVLKTQFPALVTSSGTNTITVTYSPAWSAYSAGKFVAFKAGGTNTGAATFNANGVGAIAIQQGGVALRAGAITVDDLFLGIIRDVGGTKTVQMLSPNRNPTIAQADLLDTVGPDTTTTVGYRGSPVNTQDAAYGLLLTDAGKTIYHTSGSAHTYTIPANASVAFPIGTIIIIRNENGAGNITLAITSDTLRWGSSTGSRTIAANGNCSIQKMSATVWRLTGDGIT